MACLRTEIRDATAIVTIDNPAKRNALSIEMWERIPPLMAELTAHPDVKVIVLTGAGEHFCAGSDISKLDSLGDGSLPTAAELAIAACPKPTISAIQGVCFGGGCELAAACDLRIAGEDAKFCVPPANLGIVYPLPGTARLVHLIGPAATKYLMFTAEPVRAPRALHMGLVDEVVAPDVVLERALHVAERIASRSQLTVHATKAIVDAITDRPEEAAGLASRWGRLGATGPDLAEGQAAFAERRQPTFTWLP